MIIEKEKDMTNGARPPAKGGVVAFKVNLNDLAAVGCPHCGGNVFDTGVGLFKGMSAVQSPTGKPMLAKIEVAICLGCGVLVQPVGNELKIVETPAKGDPS